MNSDNACSTSPIFKTSNSTDLKIISGGQSGVDRAALDVALAWGMPCGGVCPAERKAEDGPIDKKYPLEEANSDDYRYRTRQNVVQSHGTLIIYNQKLGKGTQLTLDLCVAKKKPHLKIDAAHHAPEEAALQLAEFIKNHFIAILNVAGPRASSWPEGHAYTRKCLESFIKGPS